MNNNYEGLYKFDTNVFMALDFSVHGKTHLVYKKDNITLNAQTLCGRPVRGPNIRWLNKVDVLGAITTTPCLQCLKLALSDTPNSIKEIER